MKRIILTIATILVATSIFANSKTKEIKLKEVSHNIVTEKGLYYEGEKRVDYQFGPQMTPHGDCLAYMDGYVFFGWWQGGVENRHLMLSRLKLGSDEWETIEFPEVHAGYLGKDSKKGDSHCTVAVGISPIDKTIHLVYDLHSFFINYDRHFKYRVSKKSAVNVSKENWNISLFNDEQKYLNSGRTYERSTYPVFQTVADGKLMLKLRFGGTGRGNTTLMLYDGNEWGLDVVAFNSSRADDDNGHPVIGGKKVDERYSIYGDPQYLYGKYHMGFAIRTENTRLKNTDTYNLNQGLYYASTDDPTMKSGWKTLKGESFELPIGVPDQLLIAQPCPIGGSMSTAPVWTVTENDVKHFIATADGKSKHYYTKPGSSELKESSFRSQPSTLLSYKDNVVAVFLDKGKLRIDTTKEGTSSWKTLYVDNSKTYVLARADMFGDKIIIFLMEKTSGDARPISCYVFEVK